MRGFYSGPVLARIFRWCDRSPVMGQPGAKTTVRSAGRGPARPKSRHFVGAPESAAHSTLIVEGCRAISAVEAKMLPAIADLNRTESFRADGFRSMVDWLVGVCHVSTARARLFVDAATDGAERPELAEALADGRVTLDVFAPLASIATPETDAELAREAEDWTPRQARQLAREVRGTSGSEAAETFRGRFLRFNEEKHSVYAQLTPDTFALVKSAILRRAVRHDHPSSFDPDYEPLETRCADALVDICVEQGGRAGGPTPARPARRPSKPVPPDDQDETPEAAEPAEPAEPPSSSSTAAARPRSSCTVTSTGSCTATVTAAPPFRMPGQSRSRRSVDSPATPRSRSRSTLLKAACSTRSP